MLLALLPLLAGPAHANERRFTYTYDTLVLPTDIVEIEPWTTVSSAGDGTLVVRNRLELEVPISNRVLTALYFNTKADAAGLHFDGVSNEWKGRILNRMVAPVGLGWYLEGTVAPTEIELEAKLLLDKEAGPLLVAYNLVGEAVLETEPGAGEWELEAIEVKNILGASVKLGPAWALGVEGEVESVFEGGELEETEIKAGPVVSVSAPKYWAAATVLPTWAVIGEEGGGKIPWATRLLVGVHL